ncbi:MAG: phosphatase PAP2 family protein [Flavobacterium sp.]|nr:phosphatase PAP2 family protein [Flavobacterium sp.]
MINSVVISNYSKLKPTIFALPFFLLVGVVLFLYSQNSLNIANYTLVQKDLFFWINSHLGQYPTVIFNLTQLGDASILLSFLIILVIYVPKMWEALLSASLFSLVFSWFFKNLFLVPRPSELYDNTSFIIVGKTAVGFASLPSGHSITVFTTLTVILFAFMPQKIIVKIFWILALMTIGLLIAFTRVGVGAHHPLDVIIGWIIGCFSGLLGIFFSLKYKLWNWINYKKYYPFFLILIIAGAISLILKIIADNLIIYYVALFSLLISFYKFSYDYFKKQS